MSDVQAIERIVELLRRKNIRIDPGLTDREIDAVEFLFRFRFPPDLRRLLQAALPTSERFYDWRRSLSDRSTVNEIHAMIDWPCDGILFDVEHADFWVSDTVSDIRSWGPKPSTTEEQFAIAKKHIATYPKLIPIFGHRYIPETPHEEGNPVFSVYQADIIYYGGSLFNYFSNELENNHDLPDTIKRIPFWSDCCLGRFDEEES